MTTTITFLTCIVLLGILLIWTKKNLDAKSNEYESLLRSILSPICIVDENGNPNIDTDHTRQSRNPVDIKIPLDKEGALKIFSGEDYELEWAMDYLNKTE